MLSYHFPEGVTMLLGLSKISLQCQFDVTTVLQARVRSMTVAARLHTNEKD